jgi:hypothetical protein
MEQSFNPYQKVIYFCKRKVKWLEGQNESLIETTQKQQLEL